MWCWTFYKVKCTRCWTFSFGKCDAKMHFCTAKMHFCIKCICNILCYKMWCKNAFLHSIKCICNILFCWTFSFGKCDAYILFCVAKMHFCIKCIFASTKCYKCIFAQLNIFLWKMFSVHFPKENVQRTFSKGKCSAPTKCTHQIHFCTAEHFPLENVQHSKYIFLYAGADLKWATLEAQNQISPASILILYLLARARSSLHELERRFIEDTRTKSLCFGARCTSSKG